MNKNVTHAVIPIDSLHLLTKNYTYTERNRVYFSTCSFQGRRNRGGGHVPVLKVPFFVRKSALSFVQTNVAVNTKLTSKVPFLFGNFDVFKQN